MMYGNNLSTSIPNPENHSETFEPKPLSGLEYGAGDGLPGESDCLVGTAGRKD